MNEDKPTRKANVDVYTEVLRSLYTGEIVPGQRLVEGDLIETFKRPRNHVRDALLRLQSEGLVEIIPFRGARIRMFDQQQAVNIVLVMAGMLALAARQAAERIGKNGNQEKLSGALESLRSFDDASGYFAYAQARELFYRVIIEISENEEIARVCPLIQGHIVQRHLWTSYSPAAHQKRFERYEAIYSAIVSGKPKVAEAAVWDFHEAGAEDRGG